MIDDKKLRADAEELAEQLAGELKQWLTERDATIEFGEWRGELTVRYLYRKSERYGDWYSYASVELNLDD